jgi:hypothetical protein
MAPVLDEKYYIQNEPVILCYEKNLNLPLPYPA